MLSCASFRSLSVAIALVTVTGLSLSAQDSAHRGRKYKPPPPTSRIEVTVLRDADSKPIENAAVVFQLIGDKGNMELKTNEDGKSVIDVLPTGSTMLLQVIAKGYQTYGGQYEIDKTNMTFGIRLKRPGEQYSIYKNHDQAAEKSDKKDDTDRKDAQKDKPEDPATPPANPQAKPQ